VSHMLLALHDMVRSLCYGIFSRLLHGSAFGGSEKGSL
jgi:hypothetical protein